MFVDVENINRSIDCQLFLAKPNKEIIASLSEAYNIKYNTQLNNVNKLEFIIPYMIEKDNERTYNSNIDLLRSYYLVKLQIGEYEEWFVIDNKIYDSMNEKEEKKIVVMSLPHELNDKRIVNYSVENYNLLEILNGKYNENPGILKDTGWSIGHIDKDLLNSYRDFKVDSKTVLDVLINDIVEIFNLNVVWDTDNRLIGFYKYIGNNEGLTFSYGKYLNTINKDIDLNITKTRLIVEGKDGLSIENVNPLGTNYIEDLSFFMYPYREDKQGKIITHSHYMSDELCKAELAYQEKINNHRGQFGELLRIQESYQKLLLIKETELQELKNEKKAILDTLTVRQINSMSTKDIVIKKNIKESQIANKEYEISSINNKLKNTIEQINRLKETLSHKNNFAPSLLKERNQFIKVAEYKDNTFIDTKDLYNAALEHFRKIREPKTTINIDVVNFLSMSIYEKDRKKLVLGDRVYVYYDKFNINIESQLVEISYEFKSTGSSEQKINITISNNRELNNEKDKWVNVLLKSMTTNDIINYKRNLWDRTADKLNKINASLNSPIDASDREIRAGNKGTVRFNELGVITHEINNKDNQVRIIDGVIGVSKYGDNELTPVITKEGVNLSKSYGELDLNNINIRGLDQLTNNIIQGAADSFGDSEDKDLVNVNIEENKIKLTYEDNSTIDWELSRDGSSLINQIRNSKTGQIIKIERS